MNHRLSVNLPEITFSMSLCVAPEDSGEKYISFQISLFLASSKTDFAESVKISKTRNVNDWLRGTGHPGLC